MGAACAISLGIEPARLIVASLGCNNMITSIWWKKRKIFQVGRSCDTLAGNINHCAVQDWVILSLLQQVLKLAKPTAEGSRENIGHNVHV